MYIPLTQVCRLDFFDRDDLCDVDYTHNPSQTNPLCPEAVDGAMYEPLHGMEDFSTVQAYSDTGVDNLC